MRRKRKRNPINWAPILAIALFANIVAGIYASRITSVVKVAVEGAQEDDQARVRALMQYIHDQPALQVNRHATESRLLERSSVAKAELTRNIFGRARLSLEYRRPVASIKGSPGAALGRDGVIFQTSADLANLPSVDIFGDAKLPTLTIASPWRPGEVAGLASALIELSQLQHVEIDTLENGGLCLNIGSKFAVELGLSEQLDQKIDFLKKQIEDDPAVLASNKTLVLVSLETPVYRIGVEKRKK
jgi:hypothetical protein